MQRLFSCARPSSSGVVSSFCFSNAPRPQAAGSPTSASSSVFCITTTLLSVCAQRLTQQHAIASSSSSAAAAATNKKKTFYDRLGISRTASQDEIKKQYKKKALECHPDMVPATQKTRAETEFRSIAEAYETISNPEKRRVYDVTTFADEQKKYDGVSKKQQQQEPQQQQYRAQQRSTAATNKATAGARHGRYVRGDTKKKHPFLSKDAQRIFREAFEGKTVHDILFKEAYHSKYGGSVEGVRVTPAGSKSSTGSGGGSEKSAQWSKLVAEAKAQLRAEFKRKHPFLDPRDVRVGVTRAMHQPDAPPGDKFPFRKCDNLKFPEGVSPGDEVAPTPSGGAVEADPAVASKNAVLEHVSDVPMTSFREGENWRGEAAKLLDPDSFKDTLNSYRNPRYEGMSYSMRRKY